MVKNGEVILKIITIILCFNMQFNFGQGEIIIGGAK